MTTESAYGVAQRLSKCVRRISATDASIVTSGDADKPLTISIGLATVTEASGEKDFLTLLRESDDALYEAKRTGRNRICVYTEETLPTHSHKTI